MRRGAASACIAVSLLLGLSCGDPAIDVPADKAVFVGRWAAGPNFFELSPSGRVDLELDGPESTIAVMRGSLTRFTDTELGVGIGACHSGQSFSIVPRPYPTAHGQAIQLRGIELYQAEPTTRTGQGAT